MTYDITRIAKAIADIERFSKDLQICNKEQLGDSKTYYAASMLLFALLNKSIDLGDMIVQGGDLGFPNTYKDIFAILVKHSVITKEMGERLSELVYYRNLLSLEYEDVKESDVRTLWKKIGIVQDFILRIKLYLNKRR